MPVLQTAELFAASVAAGAVNAMAAAPLLLNTSPSLFEGLVPWLIPVRLRPAGGAGPPEGMAEPSSRASPAPGFSAAFDLALLFLFPGQVAWAAVFWMANGAILGGALRWVRLLLGTAIELLHFRR